MYSENGWDLVVSGHFHFLGSRDEDVMLDSWILDRETYENESHGRGLSQRLGSFMGNSKWSLEGN